VQWARLGAHAEANEVSPMNRDWNFSLLEAQLKTGRTHQIRVHLSHLGFPIAGDDKYGDFARNRELMKQGLKRMFLHAHSIAFSHPITGEPMHICAPLPPELASFVDKLDMGINAA
jgi:23S rRNA pseudouridine955/2504/2580 synthase